VVFFFYSFSFFSVLVLKSEGVLTLKSWYQLELKLFKSASLKVQLLCIIIQLKAQSRVFWEFLYLVKFYIVLEDSDYLGSLIRLIFVPTEREGKLLVPDSGFNTKNA
jgi:hypothetical protein